MDLLYYYKNGTARREIYDAVGLSFVERYEFKNVEEAREFAWNNGAILIMEEE